MNKKKKSKPIVCPECGAKISYLENRQSGSFSWKFKKNGTYTKEPFDIDTDDDYNYWLCPGCGAELFNDEQDAFNFLNGKKVNVKEKTEEEEGDVIDED